MKLMDWLKRWAPWMGVCAIVLFMVIGGAMVAAQQREEYRASSFEAYLEEAAAQRAAQPEAEEPAVEEQPDTQTPSATQPDGAQAVYAAPSGKRYHFDSACPGENGREITWDEVAARGLTPCKKCAGG